MEVIKINEQDDGSAIVELEITEEEKDLLIEVGFNELVRKGMELHKENMIDDYLNKERNETG